MAKKDEDLDLDTEGGEKPKSKKLLIIGLVVVMMGISGAGAWFFAQISAEKNVAALDTEEAVEEEKKPLNYVPLSPPFVVNFDETEDISYLQVTLQVATRDPDLVPLIKEHSPALRNSLVMLLSSQDPATLNDRKGKDKLRSDTLEEVQRVMESETGKPVIDNIYFTSFVMQ
ncbi:MAG: flagellar basal body-associated FliL family protein [Gammaproteobacteria bacterium]